MVNQMTVRAPEDLQEELKIRAGKQGLTRNALVLNILWDWVKKEKKREKDEKNEMRSK
ncbi:hypothetical protein [Roseburia sp. OF03-24]|jgi:plasmid stability protein|uniref:hypothetical protein n=1 Tax=Roseburia sp. OF03-24 TaxID=2292367 RepID=UPI001313DC1C|nr:hypothetical protein [Roseburia sp. OF03-24]